MKTKTKAPAIPKGWVRVTKGKKQATDKFRSIVTGEWVLYEGSKSAHLIGQSIYKENTVIRQKPKPAPAAKGGRGKKAKTAKELVRKAHPAAICRIPDSRGLYYDHWTVVVPPDSCGIFGPMTRILGHGKTAKEAWSNASLGLLPLKGGRGK